MKNIDYLKMLDNEDFADYIFSVFLAGNLYNEHKYNNDSIFDDTDFSMQNYIK